MLLYGTKRRFFLNKTIIFPAVFVFAKNSEKTRKKTWLNQLGGRFVSLFYFPKQFGSKQAHSLDCRFPHYARSFLSSCLLLQAASIVIPSTCARQRVRASWWVVDMTFRNNGLPPTRTQDAGLTSSTQTSPPAPARTLPAINTLSLRGLFYLSFTCPLLSRHFLF